VATQTTQTERITHTFDIKSPGPQYGCIHDEASATLDAGTIYMSISTTGNVSVDFWMLNTEQWLAWRALTTCSGYRATPGIVSRFAVSHWESTVNVPSTGVYYFVFLNSNQYPVSISFTFTAPHFVQATVVLGSTSYATQSSTWRTLMLATTQQPVGLGVIFYLGAVFLVIGVATLVLSYVRSRGEPLSKESCQRC